MALTVPDVGEAVALGRFLNKTATGDVKIGLYTNDVTISDSMVIGDFTLEATADEGTYQTLTGANWSITAGSASYAQQTFTWTGVAVTAIYGYVVTDASATNVLWAEEFTDGPYAIPSGGGTVKITPVITLN